MLGLLPPHPTSGGVVVDRQGGTPFKYNIPVPVTPVFPAEQVTWFSPVAEKTLFTNTLNNITTNGNNSMMVLALAKARLSTPDAITWLKSAALARMKPNRCLNLNTTGAFNSFGSYTEQFAISGAISELRLQSVGEIIRILPAWPANLDAEFTNLRAQGGFLVSATKTDGALTALSITSTAGKTLKLLAPWNKIYVNGQLASVDGAGIVTVNTTPAKISPSRLIGRESLISRFIIDKDEFMKTNRSRFKVPAAEYAYRSHQILPPEKPIPVAVGSRIGRPFRGQAEG